MKYVVFIVSACLTALLVSAIFIVTIGFFQILPEDLPTPVVHAQDVPQPSPDCTVGLTHYFAGAYVSAAKRTTAVLSLVNPAKLPQGITITLLRPGGQKAIANHVLLAPRRTVDVKLHSWVTDGTFGLEVACAGICAASLVIQDKNAPVFAPQPITNWGCLEQR